MRRRTCAALVLCGPLVAGCGTATRVDFSGHNRPASALEVSVYVGSGGIQLDPRRLRPGPVQFDVTNQSPRAATVAVTGGGAELIRTPSIPPGGTAQLQTTLAGDHVGVGIAGRPATIRQLALGGRTRSGDDEITQP